MPVPQCKEDKCIFGLVGEAATEKKLLQVTSEVPVPVLQVSLEAPGTFLDPGTPKIHVPGARLIFIDLRPGILTSKTKEDSDQKNDFYEGFSHWHEEVESEFELDFGVLLGGCVVLGQIQLVTFRNVIPALVHFPIDIVALRAIFFPV